MDVIDIPKILLVEDNHMNSRLTEFVLEREGFDVYTVTTAEEAVDSVRNEKPDLILMDIQLPGMDGLEATRIIKGDPETAHIPVVAVTAHAMRGDEERIIKAGCEGYIAKPINTWKLGDTLSRYLKD
jgi:CheY-like chemotaxis protein